MNERIQKLADEAEDYADGIMDEGGDFHPAYTQKLAELIVRECAGLFNPKDTDSCYPPASVKEMIQEHFGVEE